MFFDCVDGLCCLRFATWMFVFVYFVSGVLAYFVTVCLFAVATMLTTFDLFPWF